MKGKSWRCSQGHTYPDAMMIDRQLLRVVSEMLVACLMLFGRDQSTEALDSLIAGIFSVAQAERLCRCGKSDLPRSVKLYSTFGGISGKTVRHTRPSASSVRSVTVSIFCEMSPIALCSSLNRSFSTSPKIRIASIDHLSPNLSNTERIGQSDCDAHFSNLFPI